MPEHPHPKAVRLVTCVSQCSRWSKAMPERVALPDRRSIAPNKDSTTRQDSQPGSSLERIGYRRSCVRGADTNCEPASVPLREMKEVEQRRCWPEIRSALEQP